ncbi:putative capsid protein [Colobopsis shohki virus 1]|nr:putative capsid protein [Colobopsis shohki virus 1]
MQNSTQTLIFNPPRLVNQPMMPLPQTVCATLEHSGIPSSIPEAITDIPPDLNWMSEIQLFKAEFDFSNTSLPSDQLWSTTVLTHVDGTNKDDGGTFKDHSFVHWNYLPFVGSRYWKGVVSYKFIAIKPPRATGKILIRYAFDPNFSFNDDLYKRSVAVEWDLGQSSEIEIDFPGLDPIEARPTWIPTVDKNIIANPKTVWRKQVAPISTWTFGSIVLETAQRYNPGSLFPDRTRILVFMVFKNASFYMPTDFRSTWNSCLTMGSMISDE